VRLLKDPNGALRAFSAHFGVLALVWCPQPHVFLIEFEVMHWTLLWQQVTHLVDARRIFALLGVLLARQPIENSLVVQNDLLSNFLRRAASAYSCSTPRLESSQAYRMMHLTNSLKLRCN